MNRSKGSAMAPNAEDAIAKLNLPPLVAKARKIVARELARFQRKGGELDAMDARALRDHVNTLRVLAEIASLVNEAASKAPLGDSRGLDELMAEWEEEQGRAESDEAPRS